MKNLAFQIRSLPNGRSSEQSSSLSWEIHCRFLQRDLNEAISVGSQESPPTWNPSTASSLTNTTSPPSCKRRSVRIRAEQWRLAAAGYECNPASSSCGTNLRHPFPLVEALCLPARECPSRPSSGQRRNPPHDSLFLPQIAIADYPPPKLNSVPCFPMIR